MQEDRRRIIEEKIGKAETRAVTSLALIRQTVKDFLCSEKGYADGEIEVDTKFEIGLDDVKESVTVDYILRLCGKRFMVIKCSPGALESRDRHVVPFARIVDSYQVPFAVVTDGSHARILDAVSGKLVAEDLNSIPDRSRAIEMLGSMEFISYPRERREREKRILLAFETIRCTEESCE